jgi:hypothetical protein
VTISTTVALSRAASPSGGDAEAEAEQQPAERAEGKEQKQASKVPAPTRESEVFTLVYENDRWELPKEPASETLQISFESALDDE